MLHNRIPVLTENSGRERRCSNRFCAKDLQKVKDVVVFRGFGYCSKKCKKEWPPIITRIQLEYDAPIELVLEICLKLFRSKRRAADILKLSSVALEKLLQKFDIKQ